MIKLMSHILDGYLPPTETLLLVALADFADEDGRCWPSKEKLALRSRVSKRTVDKYIKVLADDGWLAVEENRGRRSNVYHLNVNKITGNDNPNPANLAPQTCKPCTSDLQPMLQVRPATHAAPESPYNRHRTPSPKKPATPRQSKKPTDPNHGWFVKWWCFVCAARTGTPYAFTKKDAGIIKRLLGQLGLNELTVRACAYLLLPEQKRFPRGAPTLGGLQCQINEVTRFDDEMENQFIAAGLLPDLDQIDTLTDFNPWSQSHEPTRRTA